MKKRLLSKFFLIGFGLLTIVGCGEGASASQSSSGGNANQALTVDDFISYGVKYHSLVSDSDGHNNKYNLDEYYVFEKNGIVKTKYSYSEEQVVPYTADVLGRIYVVESYKCYSGEINKNVLVIQNDAFLSRTYLDSIGFVGV